MSDSSDREKLLGQLRIDRSEDSGPAGARWAVAGAAALAILGAGAWWWNRANAAVDVQVATAVAPAAQGSAAATILQATGYVTARRQATVSAQITGKLTEVLIEEGEHVNATGGACASRCPAGRSAGARRAVRERARPGPA
jgi:hypothetical protein